MIYPYQDNLVYRAGNDYVRSTKHPFISYLNEGKYSLINEFIDEYRIVAQLIINELWVRNFTWEVKGHTYSLWLQRGIYTSCPKFLQTGFFNCLKQYNGRLTGRALSSLTNQIISIIKGVIKAAKATKTKPVKPNLLNINPEISSKHVDFQQNINVNSIFDATIGLSALFKGVKKIIVPIQLHRLNVKYLTIGEQLGSILLSKDAIFIRYRIKPSIVCDKEEKILGVDGGINKIACFSNRTTASKQNKAGKTFKDVLNKLKQKKKGSRGYQRARKERDDYINEAINTSINSFDITEYTRVNLESNKGIKESTKNANSGWSLMCFTDKILRMCQDKQVSLYHVPSHYKSQRCFKCGYVHKTNRNKEEFKCKHCFHIDDADINAALNNSALLPYDNLWSYKDVNKSSGFFWRLNSISLT